ncbi:hypothetical protein CJ030_MR1G022550 [Morella rubra]|uniref:Uncharacterized protein n=1 Tax=Morella rubra TaxID=262757 RepID=A0A6A1WNC7_9ROSI|nr:hypothetical protein CJ030_MR1G022550 [Morella rubra]
MSKRLCTSSQVEDEQPPALMLEQHTTIIMSRSIVVERHIKLEDFYDLTFEDRTLLKVVEQAGWLPFLQRTYYAMKNMARNFKERSMEVTVCNVLITFSPNELARFLHYERDLTTFLNLPMSEEGWPTKAEVFRTMLGKDTPFWREAT